MVSYVKIAGVEHEAKFVRFRERDHQNDGRETVTMLLAKSYEEAKTLFTNPGAWSVVRRFDNTEPDMVTDCHAYEILCSIIDRQDGVLEIVMGRATDTELLQAIMGENN